MSLYQYEDIIKISNSDLSSFEINIDKFIQEYLKIERNDKYEPIFSQTSKYKSFPINGNISKKNFLNNYKWEKKKNFKNTQLKLSFNKLSFTNYNIIKDEIINILKNKKVILKIFINELFDKIFFDHEISNIYINLCKDIWNENEILLNNINIKENNKKFFFIFNNEKSKIFNSKNDLINFVKNSNILKNFIINSFRKEFYKRKEYINNIEKTNDEEKIFFLKKKIFGTVEFLSLLYNNKYLSDDIILIIINDLIKNNNLIELEAFIKLWNIIDNKKFESKYNNIIKKIINDITDERIICLLKTLIEDEKLLNKNIDTNNFNINYINNVLLEYKKTDNINDAINKLNNVNKNLLLNELIINIADTYNSKIVKLINQIFKNTKDLKNKINLIEIDEIEMPFYKKNLDLLLKNIIDC